MVRWRRCCDATAAAAVALCERNAGSPGAKMQYKCEGTPLQLSSVHQSLLIKQSEHFRIAVHPLLFTMKPETQDLGYQSWLLSQVRAQQDLVRLLLNGGDPSKLTIYQALSSQQDEDRKGFRAHAGPSGYTSPNSDSMRGTGVYAEHSPGMFIASYSCFRLTFPQFPSTPASVLALPTTLSRPSRSRRRKPERVVLPRPSRSEVETMRTTTRSSWSSQNWSRSIFPSVCRPGTRFAKSTIDMRSPTAGRRARWRRYVCALIRSKFPVA